jgi:serine/threonine protein phosphatase PrpC
MSKVAPVVSDLGIDPGSYLYYYDSLAHAFSAVALNKPGKLYLHHDKCTGFIIPSGQKIGRLSFASILDILEQILQRDPYNHPLLHHHFSIITKRYAENIKAISCWKMVFCCLCNTQKQRRVNLEAAQNIGQRLISGNIPITKTCPPTPYELRVRNHRLYLSGEEVDASHTQRWAEIRAQEDEQKEHLKFTFQYALENSSAHIDPCLKLFIPLDATFPCTLKYYSRQKILDGTIDSFYVEDCLIGVASTQGHRPRHEDSWGSESFFFMLGGKKHSGIINFVCDGHDFHNSLPRAAAANRVMTLLSNFLQDQLAIQHKNSLELSALHIQNSIKLAFAELKASFAYLFTHTSLFEYKGGTTVVAQIILDKYWTWIANLGDSRAIAITQNSIRQLSADAKPIYPKAIKNVLSRGGVITKYTVTRVESCPSSTTALSLSRGVGKYAELQDGKISTDIPGINPRPQIVSFMVTMGEKIYTVLACDGLWDVATTQQVGTLVQELTRLGHTPCHIATKLVLLALQAGSRDNITVQVIIQERAKTAEPCADEFASTCD